MKKIFLWGSITIMFIALLFFVYMFLKSESKEEESYNDIAVNDVLVEEVFKSIDSGVYAYQYKLPRVDVNVESI